MSGARADDHDGADRSGTGSVRTVHPGGPSSAGAEPAPGSAGLTAAEVAARLQAEGPNAVGGSGRRSLLRILAAQFRGALALILVFASLVSLAVGDRVEAAIILAIVATSAALGFVKEVRSEVAVAAL